MKLNKQKLSLAAAITMAIAYAVCALFTALLPNVAVKFLGWMLHLVNVEQFAGDVAITFASFLGDLLPIIFYSYIVVWIFAAVYNRLSKKS